MKNMGHINIEWQVEEVANVRTKQWHNMVIPSAI